MAKVVGGRGGHPHVRGRLRINCKPSWSRALTAGVLAARVVAARRGRRRGRVRRPPPPSPAATAGPLAIPCTPDCPCRGPAPGGRRGEAPDVMCKAAVRRRHAQGDRLRNLAALEGGTVSPVRVESLSPPIHARARSCARETEVRPAWPRNRAWTMISWPSATQVACGVRAAPWTRSAGCGAEGERRVVACAAARTWWGLDFLGSSCRHSVAGLRARGDVHRPPCGVPARPQALPVRTTFWRRTRPSTGHPRSTAWRTSRTGDRPGRQVDRARPSSNQDLPGPRDRQRRASTSCAGDRPACS
ncbi:hypothetical protein QJS66_07110 [Kocuria rhizophila]|nr:hypothetical protein QJS66_07110 [Kocuria rhizophila]